MKPRRLLTPHRIFDFLSRLSFPKFGLFCSILVVCNSLAMAAFAIQSFHRFFFSNDAFVFTVLFAQALVVVLLLAASLIIPLCFLFLGLLAVHTTSWKSLRGLRRAFAILAICFAPIIYYLDALTFSTWGLRILDPSSWESIWPILFVLPDYLTPEMVLPYTPSMATFFAVQVVGCFVACKVVAVSTSLRISWVVPATLFVAVPATILSVEHSSPIHFKDDACLQPFKLCGVRDSFSFIEGQPAMPFEDELTSLVLSQYSDLRAITAAHDRLRIRRRPTQPLPDIIIIIIESLRFDAFQPETDSSPSSAPNILRFANDSLVGTMHFANGNASHFGWYALLHGIHPKLTGTRVPSAKPALTRLLQQLGYQTAFVGSWDLAIHDMDKFINEQTVDQFELMNRGSRPKSGWDADEWTVARTCKLLAETTDPVAVIVQIVGTHCVFGYSAKPEHQVHVPFESGFATRTKDRKLLVNSYLNAVRTMDDIVAPLLRQDAIVVIVGDHGEALLDDGTTKFHGGPPSFVTTRTPLVFHVPMRAGARIHTVSSHLDILPTMMDVLQVQLDVHGLPGRSLYGERTDMLPCLLPGAAHKNLLFDPDLPDELFLCYFNPANGIVRYLGRCDEHARPYHSVRRTPDSEERFSVLFRRWLDGASGVQDHRDSTDDLRNVFRKMLADGNPEIRRQAVKILPESAFFARKGKDMFRRLLSDSNPEVRQSAVNRLRDIGSLGLDFQSDVVLLLKDESSAVRQAAQGTLRHLNQVRRVQ